MQIINCKKDLGSIEFGPFLCKFFTLAKMGKHLSSSNEIHDKEYFLFRLEGEF